jgi:rsbT co-antagonist protein RsbR
MSVEVDKLSQFLDVSRSLSRGREVDELCRSAASGLMHTGLDRCSVVVGVEYDGDGPSVGQGMAIGDVNPEMRNVHLHALHVTADYPTIQRIVRNRESVLVEDIEADERLTDREREFMSKLGVQSVIICPMVSRNRVTGYILAEKRIKRGFTTDDLGLYQAIADYAAAAIETARIVTTMEQQIEDRTREVAIFHALAENATYGVWMATPEGVVNYANRATHQIFGYEYEDAGDKREMIGLPVNRFFTPETCDQLEAHWPSLLEGRAWQNEFDGLRKDDSTFSLLMVAFGILDAQGNPLAVASINLDVTEQKQLEAEQDRLNREIINAHEQLIGELSTPLIPVTESILVLPLVGTVESVRAQQIMESLLKGVENYDAQVVIIDITGVPVLDTAVANHLIQITNAASLLGAKTVLVGIVPRVAQTLVELGVDLSIITTRNNLQGGVEYALRTQGLRIAPIAYARERMQIMTEKSRD